MEKQRYEMMVMASVVQVQVVERRDGGSACDSRWCHRIRDDQFLHEMRLQRIMIVVLTILNWIFVQLQ